MGGKGGTAGHTHARDTPHEPTIARNLHIYDDPHPHEGGRVPTDPDERGRVPTERLPTNFAAKITYIGRMHPPPHPTPHSKHPKTLALALAITYEASLATWYHSLSQNTSFD